MRTFTYPVITAQLRWPTGYTPLAAVPWEMLAPHESRVAKQHYQTLEHLASRGGMSAAEMVAVLEGADINARAFWGAGHSDPVFSDTELRRRVTAWMEAHK